MEQTPQTNEKALNRLAASVESLVKQERWTRRFANLLKLAIAVYILFFIYKASERMNALENMESMHNGKSHIAVVKLQGSILPGTKTSADIINPILEKAFSNSVSTGVIIKANSPGGSPVQSALINDEITRLKNLYKKPVYVVIEDMCASGCYYIAVAADQIYANKGSIIGSIGVRMDTFGFTGMMEKLGIENRSMHAGDHKAFIDPFGPADEVGRSFFKEMVLEKTHQQFIAAVREGRGERLKETKETYTGLVWLGEDALQNGMIDGLSDIGSVARDHMQEEHIRYYEPTKTFMEQIMGDISNETALKLSLFFNSLK